MKFNFIIFLIILYNYTCLIMSIHLFDLSETQFMKKFNYTLIEIMSNNIMNEADIYKEYNIKFNKNSLFYRNDVIKIKAICECELWFQIDKYFKQTYNQSIFTYNAIKKFVNEEIEYNGNIVYDMNTIVDEYIDWFSDNGVSKMWKNSNNNNILLILSF